jgi:predicted nucleotidyltransferase
MISLSNTKSNTLTVINKNILLTLAYFDMFNYPLTRVEIFLFLQQKCNHNDFESALRYMVASQSIYNFDTYYTLKNDPTLVKRRTEGNQKAAELIRTAHKVSELLIWFPFVRGLAISGSLSKNYADDDSDIDLFIITAKNRLWIARTLMHSLKKLTFLFNKQHYFCMNYYVDEVQLQIREKNIYTAIEVATLMPLQGDTIFEQFYAENSWTKDYLPNNYLRLSSAKATKKRWLKQLFETMLNNKLGDIIDKTLMRVTGQRWNKKTVEKRLNMHGFVLQMYAERHCSKPDPVNFQQKILQRYNDKITGLLAKDESSMVY